MQLSNERGNYGTRIRHQELDLLFAQCPSCAISGKYERSDRNIPRERSRDFKRPKRVFAAEKSKCWIVPVWHFHSLKINIVGVCM